MRSQAITALGAILVLGACAGAKVVGEPPSSNGGNPGGQGGGGGQGNPGSGGFSINLDAAPIGPPDTRKADLPPDLTGCRQDDAGNYICCPEPLRILSLGQVAKYGANSGTSDNTDAFQDFLNGNTAGTATMALNKTFTHLTDDLLKKYDLVILQALYDDEYNPQGLWSYSQSDVDTLKRWVEEGGAIIAMSGYGGNTSEVQPLNQLLKPYGISYNTDDIFNACPDNTCYCTDSSIAFGNWNANFQDITHDLRFVGVFHGRSINCSDCDIVAMDSTEKMKVGVAKQVRDGRVFAWADEWVTYTSQWGLTDSKWDIQNPECAGHTAKTKYNVPQFWYNVLRWAVPDNTCFTIIIPPEADPGQQIVY